MEKRLETRSDFLKAGEHTPIVFEKTKQTLNFVPRFVECLLRETHGRTVLCGRNDAGRPLLHAVRHDGIRILSFVRQEGSVYFLW